MINKICHYSSERNILILISLLKKYGVKKIVVSPGTTNVCFTYSVQSDSYFKLYSAPDERSAAYIACGLSEETGEPVALSCTGATASRNYVPGLTEAFYRKIPILAITSTQPVSRVGHNIPQVIDRRIQFNDLVKYSTQLPLIKDSDDEWNCIVKTNIALSELDHNGKGPVHINLETGYSHDFSVENLPNARKIERIGYSHMNEMPEINRYRRIGILCGAHSAWSADETTAIEAFCQKYHAMVIEDHTGNYHGNYAVEPILYQIQPEKNKFDTFDLIIDIGNIQGAYLSVSTEEVWRVNPDGIMRDTYRKLRYVFEMEERDFFSYYAFQSGYNIAKDHTDLSEWNRSIEEVRNRIPELPFSNAWVASETAGKLPDKCVLHLGIQKSLQVWNYYCIKSDINAYANTGGYGIDGFLSTLIGASLGSPEKIFYGVVGDLAFFYDMNSLGNRHVGHNLRIILINNNGGAEFHIYDAIHQLYPEMSGYYVAADGHYGNKSHRLVKDYVQDLGFDYYCADNKEEYDKILPIVVDPNMHERSMVVEVFTTMDDESESLRLIRSDNKNKEPVDRLDSYVQRCLAGLKDKEYIMWGTGHCFVDHYRDVQQRHNVTHVVDNNKDNWGKEVAPGIRCISPDEVHKNSFIIIMIEDQNIVVQVVHQLRKMGIEDFDTYDNWITYMCS